MFLESYWSQDAPKMAQDGPERSHDTCSPKQAQKGPRIGPRWAKIAPELLQQTRIIAQDSSKMSQDGPKMAPRWPKMVKDVCLRLSSAFILGLLGRSMALPSLCLRFAFALPSLCLRFAFALLSLSLRFAFVLLLCLCFCLPLLCLCLPSGGDPRSLKALKGLIRPLRASQGP